LRELSLIHFEVVGHSQALLFVCRLFHYKRRIGRQRDNPRLHIGPLEVDKLKIERKAPRESQIAKKVGSDNHFDVEYREECS
jgi:hypothetical protein